MAMREIVLPETKPETEWVRGRALRKVSPTYDHARLQSLLSAALTEWADAGRHGRVGTEWRFRVVPPGDVPRPLVPDVAYLSFEDFAADIARELVQVPLAAPTVAVEVRSSGDRPLDIEDKIATYLSAGTSLVLVVDPQTRTIDVRARDGATRLEAANGDVFTHGVLPGFRIDVRALFDRM